MRTIDKNYIATVRLGLLIGLFTKRQVIEWTDQIIAQTKIPDPAFIEISTSSELSEKELTAQMSNSIKNVKTETIYPIIFAIINKGLESNILTIDQIVPPLKNLKKVMGNSGHWYDISVLLEYYDLAQEDILSSVSKQKENIIQYLSKFENEADFFFELIS